MADPTQNLGLNLPSNGDFPNAWDQPLNDNFQTIDGKFSGTAGHTHSGVAGEGPKIDHANLNNKGTNTHAQIDAHIANAAIHSDTKVGTVKPINAGTGVTVNNVSELQFDNCLVESIGSGIVRITPAAGSEELIPKFAKVASAPVSYTDNFTYPAATDLGSYGWLVTTSAALEPLPLIAGDAGQTGSGIIFSYVGQGVTGLSGAVTSHFNTVVPKGLAQRVVVEVVDASGSASDGFVATSDTVSLSLDLLADSTPGGATKPTVKGLSLLMLKAAGTNAISYSVVVQPGDSGSEVVFSDFSGSFYGPFATTYGSFQNLPPSFFEGTHEFSLQRDEFIDTAFFLNYYYNGGLVFRKLFDLNSLNQQERNFADAVFDLVSSYSEISSTKPAYGRQGFGVGYSIGASSLFSLKIRRVCLSSQEDLAVLKLTEYPTQVPTVVPDVCAGGGFNDTFLGVGVGDSFDFDGPGAATSDWTVLGGFAAGVQGSENDAGFIVTSADSTKSRVVWCDPPSAATVTAAGGSTQLPSDLSLVNVTIDGTNLPTGIADTQFGVATAGEVTAQLLFGSSGFPKAPAYPTAISGYFTPGEVVGAGIVYIAAGSGYVNGADYFKSNGKSSYSLQVGTYGVPLPWGQTLDVKLTPKFAGADPDFSITVPDAITIAPTNPFVVPGVQLSQKTLVFDAATSTWVPESTLTTVPEGAYIFIGLSGVGLPLGSGYWAAANVADVPTWDLTNANAAAPYNAGHVAPPYVITPSSQLQSDPGITTLSSKFFTGVLNGQTVSVSGNPTTATITDTSSNPFSPNVPAGISLGIVSKLSYLHWSAGSPAPDVNVQIYNPLTGALFGTVFALSGTKIRPAPIQAVGTPIVYEAGTANVLTAGQLVVNDVVDVVAEFENLDVFTVEGGIATLHDVKVIRTGGWSVLSEVPSSSIVITQISPNRHSVRVNGLTIGAVAGQALSLRFRNDAAASAYINAGHVFPVTLGTTAASAGGSGQAPAFAVGSSFEIQQNINTTIELDVTDLLPGGTLSFTEAGTEHPNFKIVSSEYVGTTGVGSSGSFTLVAYAIKPGAPAIPTPTLYLKNPGVAAVTLAGTVVTDPGISVTGISVEDVGAIGTDAVFSVSATEPFPRRRIYVQLANPLNEVNEPPIMWQNGVGPGVIPTNGTGQLTQVPATNIWYGEYIQNTNVGIDGVEPTFKITKKTKPLNEEIAANTGAGWLTLSQIVAFSFNGGSTYTQQSAVGTKNAGAIPLIASKGLPAGNNLVRTSNNSPVFSGNSGISFARRPEEGRFTEFTFAGQFSPANPTGTNLTVSLVDSAGVSQVDNVIINSATSSLISGSALMKAGSAGKLLSAEVVNNTLSKTVVNPSYVTVAKPPAPRVTSMTIDGTAGSSGATIKIYGKNLVPPSSPGGQAALSYGYTLTSSGTTPVFTSIVAGPRTDTQLTFTANIAADAATKSFGITIDYLGGNVAVFSSLGTIAAAAGGNPQVETVQIYAENANPLLNPVPAITATGRTARLRITGTGLGAYNVDPGGLGAPPSIPGVFLEVVGENSSVRDISSGLGLGSELSALRIPVLELIKQSDVELIARVDASSMWANTRVRVVLKRPASHPSGATEWTPIEIDATGVSTSLGLLNPGITAVFGTNGRPPTMNVNPTVGAETQLTVTQSLQAQCGAGTEGDNFSITVRMGEAYTGSKPPVVVAVPDPVYGVQFENIVVQKDASPFRIIITGKVPTPGVNNSYPGVSFVTTTPVRPSLRFANGVVIASALLGGANWGTGGSGINF